MCKNASRTKESFGLFLTVLSINSTLNFHRGGGGLGELVGFCFFRAARQALRKREEKRALQLSIPNDNPYDSVVSLFPQRAVRRKFVRQKVVNLCFLLKREIS